MTDSLNSDAERITGVAGDDEPVEVIAEEELDEEEDDEESSTDES